ncbi:NAD(P)/FAD-dependent oxidoreductase [Halomarina oriensis]|uniref:FAD-binding protein n=1 Tax=Halomarina oriensis TaxID=671145 RepID=A0A6B0GME7_9EURY|nr:NAD(P)/FAD-dependent oxidoreductase [Halomarina oriensis]MWG36032.1 FAD-binding protein [Halomarina oriensis]
MQQVDVAIVGGGPAGTSAAHAAASAGAEAVVVEKGVPRADREGLGPDSTDAAGILDYWVDIMALDEPVPEWVKARELHAAEFLGPNESVTLESTGQESTYPNFGFTMHRSKFDDWLRQRAEDAGAEYRVGNGVREVETDFGGPTHTLVLRDGSEIRADHLILADGPQRTVTNRVLDPLLPHGTVDKLASTKANHIAYQEYREFPAEAFEEDRIKFWWGVMPGHTAYPWVFPNDGTVARVGLTMPIGMDLSTVPNRDHYKLLRPEDSRIPQGKVYIERLFELAYPEYDLEEFPLVTDRGKQNGTETYPISSTMPIDSPTVANVAVTGGAMGATSAFHEGGDHVAVRTGAIAGRMAANDTMRAYNSEWKHAIGDEVVRNLAFAELARGLGPADWDREFATASAVVDRGRGFQLRNSVKAGLSGLSLFGRYYRQRRRFRKEFVQIHEDEYAV